MGVDTGGDNFRFDITGASLEQALEIATSCHKKMVAWRVEDGDNGRKRLVLFWVESADATPLPAPMVGNAIVAFVRSWLEAAEYGPQPQHDGSNGRGCRVYNESWGHVNGNWAASIAIEPIWLTYGK